MKNEYKKQRHLNIGSFKRGPLKEPHRLFKFRQLVLILGVSFKKTKQFSIPYWYVTKISRQFDFA